MKDAHGNALADGDTVALIKDLKLESDSQVLKAGTKAKNIRLQDGNHEIACKIDGSPMALKACFVKKSCVRRMRLGEIGDDGYSYAPLAGWIPT